MDIGESAAFRGEVELKNSGHGILRPRPQPQFSDRWFSPDLVVICAAITEMDALTRRAFTLRKVYCFPEREIAQQLNISCEQVRSALEAASRLVARAMDMPAPKTVDARRITSRNPLPRASK
jgi:hypothetical protein